MPETDSNGYIRSIYRSLLLVWRAAPGELGRLAVLNLISGSGPAALLLLGKVVIDETARLAQPSPAAEALARIAASPVLLWSVVAFVAIYLLIDATETVAIFEFYEGGTRDPDLLP
jgi:ATP-binding cassette subfamily B protein